MHSHLRITDASLLRRPAIVAAWVAVLAISGCSQPASEVAQPVGERATRRPQLDRPERSSDDPSRNVESATDLPDATNTPQPPSGPDSEIESSGSQREKMLQRFTTRHGQHNVVVIRVSHAKGLRPGVLVQKLTHDLGGVHFFATRPSADAILAVPYSGDIEDVAEHIDWGKVTSTNPQQRLISVDGSQD
jgi:hypothetical protein